MMIQLVFSVCSIVEGAACHELPPVPLKEGTTIVGCLMASQVEGAEVGCRAPQSVHPQDHVWTRWAVRQDLGLPCRTPPPDITLALSQFFQNDDPGLALMHALQSDT
jgi:hypothetical protein